jgi:hypothetical protein
MIFSENDTQHNNTLYRVLSVIMLSVIMLNAAVPNTPRCNQGTLTEGEGSVPLTSLIKRKV